MDDTVRVLLVEDSDADAELAAEVLAESAAGTFAVVRSRRLADAEQRLRSERIDLVVLDLSLPDSQGTGTVERISAAAPGTPLVLFTGTLDGTTLARAVEGGVTGVALKNEPLLRTFAQKCAAAVERHRRTVLGPAMTTVIETVPDAIVVVDGDGRVLFANLGARALLDMAVLDGRLDLPDGSGPADLEISGQTGARLAELRSAPLEWFGQPARLVSLRDVTEQREIADRLRTAQKFEALGRMAGGIAHDFNNLLAVVLGCADRLLDGSPTEERRATLLSDIRQAAESAAELTGQLLTFTHTSPTASAAVDLTAVVRSALSLLERLTGAGIELVTDLQPDLPPIVADRAQVQQVLLNLTVNARDAMSTGGRLEISTATSAGPPEHAAGPAPEDPVTARTYVRLRVSDTGEGMTERVKARLFEPFFSTKPRGRGTGLGLATVHGVVSRSGGLITVDSEPGHGAAFTVYLPTAVTVAEPAPRETRQPPAGPSRGPAVLLVDDEQQVRDLFQEVLEEAGFQVLPAGSGEAALVLAADRPAPVDLLITDVIMPGMSGFELIAALRASQPGLRTMVLTGYPEQQSPDGAAPDAYLTKPIKPSALVHEVRAALAR